MENELPKGWVEAELKNLTDFVIGGDWGKTPEKEYEAETELVYCIRGSEIKNWNKEKGETASLRKIKPQSLEKRKLKEGDILIEISGGGPEQPVGRTVFIDKETLNTNKEHYKVCTNFLRLLRLNDTLNKKFIQNYFNYFYLTGEIIKYQGGSNNLRNLKYKEFETIKIPLPPKSEQERIVAKLDHLFTELDTLNQKLNQIPNLLKKCRQAILNQAVTGKLTKEWRKGKPLDVKKDLKDKNIFFSDVDENGWAKSTIKDYLINLDNKRIPISQTKRRERKGKYPYYGATGIIDGIDGYTHDGEFILISEDGKNLKYRTKPISFLAKGKIWVNNHAHVLQSKKGFNNLFAIYYFNSIDLTNYITGIDQLKLSQKNLNIIPISIPSMEEQTEIVHRVEQLFTELDHIEAKYKTLKQQTDNLPQAILHKAFKGELVSQLATDGNAEDLLVQIKEERQKKKDKKR